MKLMMTVCALLSFCTITNAQGNGAKESKKCDETIAYRPGGSTLQEARFSFSTELEILLNSCAVQDLTKAENANFYIRAFNEESGKLTVKYDKYIFENGTLKNEFTCELVQTQVPVKSKAQRGMPSLAMEQNEVKNSNVCKDKSNPKNYVCQKGWVDCMPGAAKDGGKYCTPEFAAWSVKNCGGAPQIAE